MIPLIVYCKNHKRRPIRLGPAPIFRDVQGDYPPGWCITCGGEVFDRGQSQCIRCRGAKGEIQ